MILPRSWSSDGSVAKALHAVLVEHLVAHERADENELFVPLGVLRHDFRGRHRIGRVGDRHGADEHGPRGIAALAVQRDLRKPVLDDLQSRALAFQLHAQIRELRDGQSGILRDNDHARVRRRPFYRPRAPRLFQLYPYAVSRFGRPDNPLAPGCARRTSAPFHPSRPPEACVGYRLGTERARGPMTSVPPSQGGNELKGVVVSESRQLRTLSRHTPSHAGN